MPSRKRAVGRRVLIATALLFVAGASPSIAAGPGSSLEEARARLAAYTEEFNEAAARSAEAQLRLAEVQERFDTIEQDIRGVAEEMMANQDAAIALAKQLYQGSSMDAMEALLTSQSLSDVDAQLRYMEFMSDEQTRLFEDLAVDNDRLEQQISALSGTRRQAMAIAQELEAVQQEVAAKLAAIESDVAMLEAELSGELAAARDAAAAASAASSPHAAPVPGPPYNADWDAIAQCESGGNWHLDGQYDGGLQFHPATWLGNGGGVYADYAWQASREQQIAIAENVLASQGPGAWPHCYKSL